MLTFFCELPAEDLRELFARDDVVPQLQALNARVSLALYDLSEERAAVARQLNEAGIPLHIWLLLPMEQGYWFNVNNVDEALRRYDDFLAWVQRHDLRVEWIGLDIEPDRREIEAIMADRSRLLPYIVTRLFDTRQLKYAQAAYGRLVDRIRADGYKVESYHLPFIVDAREIGSTLLGRLGGLVDVPVDREVLMLYTSFLSSAGVGSLVDYGQLAQAIAVGSTGGGVDIGEALNRTLSWDEFARDLRLAKAMTEHVYVFSLEGCVQQGFLEPLTTLDWDAPVTVPDAPRQKAKQIRSLLRAVLWIDKNFTTISLALAVLWLLRRLIRR